MTNSEIRRDFRSTNDPLACLVRTPGFLAQEWHTNGTVLRCGAGLRRWFGRVETRRNPLLVHTGEQRELAVGQIGSRFIIVVASAKLGGDALVFLGQFGEFLLVF